MILKTHRLHIPKYRCIKNLILNLKNNEKVLDLTLFSQELEIFSCFFFFGYIFIRTSFPVILFPETLLAAFILFRKKSPRYRKLRILFSVSFFPRTWKNSDFFPRFLFPGFFAETFFPGTFLHRFPLLALTSLQGGPLELKLTVTLSNCKLTDFTTSNLQFVL